VTDPIYEETPGEIPNPFSASQPKLQTAWDSTSIGYLLSCPRKYQYAIVEGMQPGKMSPPLEFGILFHSCLEYFHKCRAGGMSVDEGLQATVRQTFRLSQGFTGDGDGKKYRTRFTLIRSVIWYIDRFRYDSLETLILENGKPAVELSFRLALPLISPDGDPYLFCGHIDRAVTQGEDTWVSDYKTTSSSMGSKFFEKFCTNWQQGGYIFAGSIIFPDAPKGSIIDGAQLMVGATRFQRGVTERSPAQIDEWLKDFLLTIKQAEQYAEANYWPMNRSSCDDFGGCIFRDKVCGKDPSVRAQWLHGEFTHRPWNPLISRGD